MEISTFICNLKFYNFAWPCKNLAKHSTDVKDDDNESTKDINEDVEENIDKKGKG